MNRWQWVSACVGLAVSASASAAIWATTGWRAEIPAIAAVDTKTFVQVEGKRLVWIYYVTSDENGFVKAVTAYRTEYDCKRRESAERQYAEYSPKTFEVEKGGLLNYAFSAPTPDTIAQGILDFVCGYFISEDRPGPFPAFVKMPGAGVEGLVKEATRYFADRAADRAKAKPANTE